MTSVPPPAAEEAALRAVARAPGTADPLGSALRTGILRRHGRGPIAGVCAALAEAGGLPPRTVRLAALGLLALGIGLPLYVGIALVIPRESIAADEADAPTGRPDVDRPILAVLGLRARTGDVMLALALVPAVLLAYAWVSLIVLGEPAPLLPLVPIEAVILIVLSWAAVRARRARTSYLFAQLGQRAGILDEAELAETVEALQRAAPAAWGSGAPGPAARRRRSSARGRDMPDAPRLAPRGLGARGTLALLASLLGLGTAVFLLVSMMPGLVPVLGDSATLPGIGRLAAAAGAIAVAAGVVLVALGLARRRSAAGAVAGLLALALFAGGVTWVRLTDGGDQTPIVVTLDSYAPGFQDVCAGAASSWSRPVVLDLRALAADREEALARWQRENPGRAASEADLTMSLACDRTVGDLTVLLPSASSGVTVVSSLEPLLGSTSGPQPVGPASWSAEVPSVMLYGTLSAGDLTYVEAAS